MKANSSIAANSSVAAIADHHQASSGIPAKALGAVFGAVVVAHALVLQLAGDALEAGSQAIARPFTTRAVAVSVAEPVAAPVVATAIPTTRAATVTTASPKPPKPPTPPKPRKQPTVPSAAATVVGPVAEEKLASSLAEQAQIAPEIVAIAEPEKTALPTPSAAAAAPPEPLASAPAAAEPPVAVAKSTPPAPPKAPAAAVALTLPGSVRLLYKSVALVNGVHWNVNGELLWLQDGATYDARLELSLFGLRKIYSSKGNISAEGLLPTRFGDKFRSAEVAAHFERDKQKVVFSANTPDVPLLPGMQDQLSVVVQAGAMLAGAPGKYPPGTQLSFEVIGPRHLETWVFEVQGEEMLSLPNGEFATIKLTRPKRAEFDRTDEFWLAPKLGYLPVRIKFTERNGDFVDQQWRATETP